MIKFVRRNNFLGIFGFSAFYAAKKFLQASIGDDEVKWLSPTSFTLPDSGMTVDSEHLEEIIEYEFKSAEEKWEVPQPYASYAHWLLTGEKVKIKPPEHFEQPNPDASNKNTSARTGPRKKSEPRAARVEGMKSIAELCTEIDMDPREARGILRKSNTPKPDIGWAWDDKGSKAILALLKKERKK
jgi:hypothetical protein